jgi:hypothetical protein
MVKLMRKKPFTPKINQSVTQKGYIGNQLPNFPPSNSRGKFTNEEGVESSQSVTEGRNRVNLSVPVGVYSALSAAADRLGLPISQVCLIGLLRGIEGLNSCVGAVQSLKTESNL